MSQIDDIARTLLSQARAGSFSVVPLATAKSNVVTRETLAPGAARILLPISGLSSLVGAFRRNY